MLDEKDPQSIDKTLSTGMLSSIVHKARLLTELSTWLTDQLPHEFTYRCRILNIHPPRLVIGVRDNATAMQLKYRQWDIMGFVEKHPQLNHITQLDFKICPDW